MAGGQWEVVGGKSKKTKSKPKNVKNKPSSEMSEPVATAFADGSISENTMFDAFLDNNGEIWEDDSLSTEVFKKGEKNAQKKKKLDKKPTSSKQSIEKVIGSLSVEDFREHLATLERLCPSSPLVWLKDLATYFNGLLSAQVEDPTFANFPADYPSCLLDKKIFADLHKIYNRCSFDILRQFFECCMLALIQVELRGASTLGFRLILQTLVQSKPSVVLESISKCAELCNTYQNRQSICHSVMWVAAQAGNNSFETGFRVWNDLMFPLIGLKCCTNFVLDNIEKLIEQCTVLQSSKVIIDVGDLFPILDFVHSKEYGKNVQKRLLCIYPTLKAISHNQDPQNRMSQYFPSYLHRLDSHCSPMMKNELFDSLVYCLEMDQKSFSVWRQLYTKHLSQSKMLISHMNENWDTLSSKLERQELKKTLSVFQVTNEELYKQGKKNANVEETVLICQEFLLKLSQSNFSWLQFIMLLLLVLVSMFTYDVLRHGSFEDSLTGTFLRKTNVLKYCAQAQVKLSYFCNEVLKLAQTHAPTAAAWCQTTLWPLIEKIIQGLISIASEVWYRSQPVRSYLSECAFASLTVVDEMVKTHYPVLSNNVKNAAVDVSTSVFSFSKYAVEYVTATVISLQSNEQVKTYINSASDLTLKLFVNLQEYCIYFYQSIQNYFTFLRN